MRYIFAIILTLSVCATGYAAQLKDTYINGSLGVGTNTPATELHVVGAITATSFSGNALFVPPSVTIVPYVNGTTTVTWQNINTPQIASLNLTGATCTVSMTGGGTGSVHRMFVIQDGTGTRTVTWATATVFFSGGTKPVLSATPSAKDELEFVCLDGVGYYCTGFSPDIK